MRALLLVVSVGLTASLACAANVDVDGKWYGHIDTRTGRVPVGFVFKAEGSSLSGSTTAIDGSDIPLKSGKIEGQTVSFTVDVEFGGMPMELAYRGVVSADQIYLTATFMGMSLEFTVTRVKK